MEDLKKLTDEKLVEYIRTKDQESYLEIVLRYQEKLTRYAKYLVQDEYKSEDVVQNTFIKAFINLNNFNIKKKFSTWIYRIAHNEAINEIVKHKREMPLLEDMDFQSDENIELDFSKNELREKLEDCISKIPILYSEPISLFFLEEKSYEEISDILRLPISTVGTRINRAKILMKKICQTMKN
ncbi:MAG: sigma-70 family RNA polymerase sigma factor [Patescibacteria group bacterium]|nr:sigma-70 family RNA polymerase sigma factor [Patescibacteria group bacterium]